MIHCIVHALWCAVVVTVIELITNNLYFSICLSSGWAEDYTMLYLGCLFGPVICGQGKVAMNTTDVGISCHKAQVAISILFRWCLSCSNRKNFRRHLCSFHFSSRILDTYKTKCQLYVQENMGWWSNGSRVWREFGDQSQSAVLAFGTSLHFGLQKTYKIFAFRQYAVAVCNVGPLTVCDISPSSTYNGL